jgi:cholesterol transport system auxiliary component
VIRTRLPSLVCSALVASSFVLAGCGQGAVANRKYFLLNVTPPESTASFHSAATLQVRGLNVDQAFATRQLVYRVDPTRYEPDFYNQFLIAPGTMITEETRDWLAASGLFLRVLSANSAVEPTYTLEGNITALYADFTTKPAPEAVVTIHFYLLAAPDTNEPVILSKAYRAVSPVATNTADAVVDAMSQSLTEILSHLETDMEEAMIERGRKKEGGKG